MVDKRILIGGFAVGVAAGTAFLAASGPSAPIGAGPPMDQVALPQPVSTAPPARYSPNPPRMPPEDDFARWVRSVADANGGKISLGQMAALAEIYSRTHGGQPAYSDRLNDGYQMQRALPSYGADVAYGDPYGVLRRLNPPTSRSSNDYVASRSYADEQSTSRYQGSSGAGYQYDLNNPADQLRYGVDPMAQLRDSISVDPRVEMDRSLGQQGGGIER